MTQVARPPQPIRADQMAQLVGTALGPSPWWLIDQPRIDAFAEATDDRQFIHIDPERAALSPWGGTIAHGFLTLSMLAPMMEAILPPLEDVGYMVNYGADRLRFVAPVPAGSRIRALGKLQGCNYRGAGRWMLAVDLTIEIEGSDHPALVAAWLTMLQT